MDQVQKCQSEQMLENKPIEDLSHSLRTPKGKLFSIYSLSISKFSDHYSDKGTTYNDKKVKQATLKGGISDIKIENINKNQTFNSDAEDTSSIHQLIGSTMVSCIT